MAELPDAILKYLVDKEGFDSLELAKELKIDHQKVVGAIKSIQAVGEVRFLVVNILTTTK